MAVINKTGITNGGTIEAEHVTRAIDALSGVSTDTIIATGSFTGSFTGLADVATSASFATTAASASKISITNTLSGTGPYYPVFVDNSGNGITPRIDSGTYTYNATTNTLTVTSSYATNALTASYALNAGGGGGGADQMTLHFFHSTKTNTTASAKLYIGSFPAAPSTNASRIGVRAPFDCNIVRANATSYVTSTATSAGAKISIVKNSSITEQIASLDFSVNVDSVSTDTTTTALDGDILSIEIAELTNSSAVYIVSVDLLLERV